MRQGNVAIAFVTGFARSGGRGEQALGGRGIELPGAQPPRTLSGKIAAVDPNVDSVTRAVKLRASVQETGVTVSIGWAAWEGETADALLRRADEALYAAKARGRDCAVGAPATLPRRR